MQGREEEKEKEERSKIGFAAVHQVAESADRGILRAG